MSDAARKVLRFERTSFRHLIEKIDECSRDARGVAAIIVDDQGCAQFRLVGFDGPNDTFLICGLLDWIKADLLSDLINRR